MLTAFGSKWYSSIVFEDKMPRKLNEIFPQLEVKKIFNTYINNS
jgi:hypothetical protein